MHPKRPIYYSPTMTSPSSLLPRLNPSSPDSYKEQDEIRRSLQQAVLQGGLQLQHYLRKRSFTHHSKAVVIGINYFNQRGVMQGRVDEAKALGSYLHECMGYPSDNIILLTDDKYGLYSQPTKRNIILAMHWLVKNAEPGDRLVFYYSGHGGNENTPNLYDSEEKPGHQFNDIYPMDFDGTGCIPGSELHRIMVRSLQEGVKLTIVTDTQLRAAS